MSLLITQDECSFVSLRDVERAMKVMVWFYNHRDALNPLMDEHLNDPDEESDDEDDDDSEDDDNEDEQDELDQVLVFLCSFLSFLGPFSDTLNKEFK